MEVKIENVGEMTVVAMRHIGPYERIGDSFKFLFDWLKKHHIPHDRALALYHEDPRMVPVADLRSDACVMVSDDFVLPKSDGLDLRIEKIPAGEYAATTHVGSYEKLGATWEKFVVEELPKLDREVDRHMAFELYVIAGAGIMPSEQRTTLYTRLAS